MMKHATVLLLITLLLVSCNVPSDAPIAPVKTKVGSTYTYNSYLYDSNDSHIAGSDETIISTVLQTDASIAGKHDVLVVEDKSNAGSDRYYYKYESDNTFSILLNGWDLPKAQWLNLPITSMWAHTVTIVDTVFINGHFIIIHVETTASDDGSESLSISNQEQIETRKIELTTHEVWSRNGSIMLDETTKSTVNYSASIGFIVKTNAFPYDDSAGNRVHGNIEMLTSYNLK